MGILCHSTHTITSDYLQLYASSICAPLTIEGINDSRPLLFPTCPLSSKNGSYSYSNITWTVSGLLDSAPAITYSGLHRSGFAMREGSATEFAVKWVQLPETRLEAVLSAGPSLSPILRRKTVRPFTSAIYLQAGGQVNHCNADRVYLAN